MPAFPTLRRLHARGPMSGGLIVDADGVSLGPDCVLVRRTSMGYRVVNPVEVECVLRYAFRDRDEFSELTPRLDRIARALEAGELAKAQILGLQLSFDELDDNQLRRLEVGTSLVKAGYDPSQARDEDGRWTSGSRGSGATATTSITKPSASSVMTLGAAAAPPIATRPTLLATAQSAALSAPALPSLAAAPVQSAPSSQALQRHRSSSWHNPYLQYRVYRRTRKRHSYGSGPADQR